MVEVCTDDLPEIAEEAGVVSIPTIKIYYGGELMDTIVGCVAKNVLGNAVEKILDDLGLLDDDNANANANASEDGADDANASEDGAEDGVVTTSGSVSGDKVEDEDEDEEEEDEAVDEDEDEDDHNSNDQQKKDD